MQDRAIHGAIGQKNLILYDRARDGRGGFLPLELPNVSGLSIAEATL